MRNQNPQSIDSFFITLTHLNLPLHVKENIYDFFEYVINSWLQISFWKLEIIKHKLRLKQHRKDFIHSTITKYQKEREEK